MKEKERYNGEFEFFYAQNDFQRELRAHLAERDWTDDASCKGMTPEERDETFYPPSGRPTSGMHVPHMPYCSACPVWSECYDYALGNPRE